MEGSRDYGGQNGPSYEGSLSGTESVVEALDAPYIDYTALPGVIPPLEVPQYRGKFSTCMDGNQCVLNATQPIIPVPVKQEVIRKETIVEVPQTIVRDVVQPKVWTQEVVHEVPRLVVDQREKRVKIPQIKVNVVEETESVPVAYNMKLMPTWVHRAVPRIIPKYEGQQETINIPVPQIQIVDKREEHEVPVYVGEKVVVKDVEREVPEDVVTYQYVKKLQDVPVTTYKPVCDVVVNVPAPVIVPVPVEPSERCLESERISWDQYNRSKKATCGVKRHAFTGATFCGNTPIKSIAGVPGCEPFGHRADAGLCSNLRSNLPGISQCLQPEITHQVSAPPPAPIITPAPRQRQQQ